MVWDRGGGKSFTVSCTGDDSLIHLQVGVRRPYLQVKAGGGYVHTCLGDRSQSFNLMSSESVSQTLGKWNIE